MIAGALILGGARPAEGATAPPPPDTPPAAEAQVDADGGQGFRMFPIGFWGSLSYDLRAQDASSAGEVEAQRSLQHYLTARLDGMTYVWQPWFGNFKAGVGVTMGWSDVASEASPARDTFLTGSARLSLFPRSGFPFEAFYEATDTRVDGGLIALPPARWTRAGLSQTYRPAGGAFGLLARVEHAEQDSAVTGRDVQQLVDVSGDTSWPHNSLSITTTATRNSRGRSDEDAEFASLYARHSYTPSADFSFDSNANLTRQRYDGPAIGLGATVLQYMGLAYWRPVDRPYTVTGTARLLALDNEGAGQTRTANLTVGATYDYSRNLRLNANALTTYVTSQGDGQALYAASAGVSYTGDAIPIREYEYNWSVNSALSAAGRSGSAGGVLSGEREGDGSTFAASGSFTHSIGRAFDLSRTQVLGATLTQTVTAAKATDDVAGRDDLVRLATDLALTYTAGAAPLAGYARLTLTDSRSLVRSGSVFQMANFQLSGTWEFSRYSRLTGDLSAQWVRSDIPPRRLLTPESIADPGSRTASTGVSANIAYNHQRVFGVPRLRFLSELRIADEAVLEQEQAMLLPDRESASWENRLDYAIGRLLFSASLRISEMNRNQTRLLMLRVQRDFDGVAFR